MINNLQAVVLTGLSNSLLIICTVDAPCLHLTSSLDPGPAGVRQTRRQKSRWRGEGNGRRMGRIGVITVVSGIM